MNFIFFPSVVIGATVAQYIFYNEVYFVQSTPILGFTLENGWAPLLLNIFISNLVFSAVIFVTLPGFVFFPLPAGILVFRAVSWGSFIYNLPLRGFLATLPVITLEGEGYVLAAVAGTVAGASWVKPALAYGEEDFSRGEALRMSMKECLRVYFLLALMLFAGAIVETATIVSFG
jgi:hypothetical protein